MATIEERLKNVRTLEDIFNLLTIIFTNINNQNEMYYDMFINPVPMDLKLERYDENGELVTVELANRAKDKIWMQTGNGSPEGRIEASTGTFYLDLDRKNLYFKAEGEDSYNWKLVWSINNLDYLSPTGDGSGLTNLNASQITEGILSVTRGGTGTGAISGVVQGNGIEPFTSYDINAITSALNSFIGMIMWCPMDEVPSNWLICNGAIYDTNVRPELALLCTKLGNKYGGNGVNTFGVPNLIGKYAKGGAAFEVGSIGSAQVGGHAHSLAGLTTLDESSHKHAPGNLNATGQGPFWFSGGKNSDQCTGVFSITSKEGDTTKYRGVNDDYVGSNDPCVTFNLANGWNRNTMTASGQAHRHLLSGSTGTFNSGKINDVDHMILIPVIRY